MNKDSSVQDLSLKMKTLYQAYTEASQKTQGEIFLNSQVI